MTSLRNTRIKPEFTALAKNLYQTACNFENMDLKHGKGLSKEENNIRRYILIQSPI